RILDGDDGLFREIADKIDLLIGERSHLLAIDGNCADRLTLLEHWHGHVAARAAEPDCIVRDKRRFRRAIGEVNGSLRADDMLKCASRRRLEWSTLPDELRESRRHVEFCRRAQRAVLIVEHDTELCPA